LVFIPTNENAGLEDAVSDHLGSAPCFALYDSSTGSFKTIEKRNAHHSHGICHPMNQLAKYHIDCVVCSGMGRRAIEALSTKGTKY
jgi:predicted Fe-Mo cluster-binding NifX family protein